MAGRIFFEWNPTKERGSVFLDPRGDKGKMKEPWANRRGLDGTLCFGAESYFF